MTKKQHYMTRDERLKLEAYLRAGKTKTWIAREMGFSRQTIYNEIKRGKYVHTCDFWDEERYSADKGQDVTRKNQQNKGRPLKIGNDRELASFLEHKIVKERFSPAAALAAAKEAGYELVICVNTLYDYIDKGIFLELSNKHLLYKKDRRHGSRKEPRIAHPKLPSITERPEAVNERKEYGHWEMDLIVGRKGTKAVLLTLTERRTREEIIMKLPDRKGKTVRKAFDDLERKTTRFREKFRSITTDNGSEFLEYESLTKSIHGGKRFTIYYCHSYSAWEKGSNENGNRIIRRFFPKGTDFTRVTKKRIAAIQAWMNNYPRKILDWKTPCQMAA